MQYFINKSVILLTVAIWPVTGQDLQNSKWQAVRYFDYGDNLGLSTDDTD